VRVNLLFVVVVFAQMCAGQISFERIRDSQAEPGNWLTYSGDYQSHRYSSLAQINKSNVANLKVAWIYQMRQQDKVETSPIVIDGVIYITENGYIVTALDGKTGRPLWQYRRNVPSGMDLCCGMVNRGLAVLGNTLYFGTIDAHLIALDIGSGSARWDIQVSDFRKGYSITAAPLAIKDKIIVGMAGGDSGLRGFLDAYDAKTGRRIWRCWTVPGLGEPGNESWEQQSWQKGGAATWLTGSYDPRLNLIYWGTGNPWPDLNGDNRKGDNLYSSSILAVDADTGKIKWHFQFTPHDTHDWDANQIPILVDISVQNRARKLLVEANRNAFYYVLDRETGEFLWAVPYVKQTWAKGIDSKGRPIRLPNSDPTSGGTLIYPGFAGGTTWFSPSYDPLTNLFYVSTQESFGQIYFKTKTEETPGHFVESGTSLDLPGVEWPGVVKALELETGKVRWEFPLHSHSSAGLLSTAGGVVVGGTYEGDVFALDAESGQPLWHFQTGGRIGANPITFLMEGKQYIAITAGHDVFVFSIQ
jgi:alcohol dehydrogenase (cytochrome c)